MGSGNWIIDNLNSALEMWNGRLEEIWQLITTSPENFKGGGIWNIIVGINGGLKAVGYALLVLFFVMGIVKTCGSFAEMKKPELAFKCFIRFVLAQAAFLLDGQGLTAVFGRYAQQIEAISYEGAGLADHAPGVYSLMTVASVREFSGMGMYLAFASALLVAFALIHERRETDADTLLLAALLLAAGLPLILPQMNARCLYLAGMLAFACVNGARRLAIAIVLELISLCSYMEAIFSFTVIPMNVLSLLAIACAAALALELMGKLGIKGAQIGESDA